MAGAAFVAGRAWRGRRITLGLVAHSRYEGTVEVRRRDSSERSRARHSYTRGLDCRAQLL